MVGRWSGSWQTMREIWKRVCTGGVVGTRIGLKDGLRLELLGRSTSCVMRFCGDTQRRRKPCFLTLALSSTHQVSLGGIAALGGQDLVPGLACQ